MIIRICPWDFSSSELFNGELITPAFRIYLHCCPKVSTSKIHKLTVAPNFTCGIGFNWKFWSVIYATLCAVSNVHFEVYIVHENLEICRIPYVQGEVCLFPMYSVQHRVCVLFLVQFSLNITVHWCYCPSCGTVLWYSGIVPPVVQWYCPSCGTVQWWYCPSCAVCKGKPGIQTKQPQE